MALQVVLRCAWGCWQEWVQLTTDLKDQQRFRKLRAALADWRVATRAAEKRWVSANTKGSQPTHTASKRLSFLRPAHDCMSAVSPMHMQAHCDQVL